MVLFLMWRNNSHIHKNVCLHQGDPISKQPLCYMDLHMKSVLNLVHILRKHNILTVNFLFKLSIRATLTSIYMCVFYS